MRSRSLMLGVSVVLLSVSLVGCRRQATVETPSASDQQTQDETNRFLTQQGVTLPAGAQRAYLSGGESNRGVATREATAKGYDYAIVTSLPQIKTGFYQAFIKDGNGAYISLGKLTSGKGGYIGEASLNQTDLANYNIVEVSQETTKVTAPTNVVMAGTFGQ